MQFTLVKENFPFFSKKLEKIKCVSMVSIEVFDLQVGEGAGVLTYAVGGGAAIAALSAALLVTDPSKR